ncbi:MAG TPA: proton-conducting transporter membrane subunit [Symbiobacteriaceae bacterium]|nr:proton-conducting transporter membrane subunit [Symbiobacteriaceae bacterium]
MEVDPHVWLLGLGFAALALGAAIALVPLRSPALVTYGCAALGAAALAAGAVSALLAGRWPDLGAVALLPGMGGLRFHMDALSAYFVLLIGGLGAAVSVYAIGYADGQARLQGSLWSLFIAAMAAVVLSADGLGFLFSWEVMAVVSFLLVMAEHRDPEVRQAGYFYVVMTHVGTAFIIGAFLTLYAASGSLGFEAFRAAAAGLPVGVRSAVFVMLVVGFGTKAGLVPLHVWLPRAHPAAPSHVSALMSGAMVKTAIYGHLRFSFDLLGGGSAPAWWGGLLVALGAVSAVTGVLYATQQTHLKRLLAYSTVENVGLLVMGVGAGLVARSFGLGLLSVAALAAVLFHAVSHAAFKGLAFMGAGAVLHGTGTADMERLGGLIRRMPRAAALFLVAAMAVAGLPPLSGFIGEWLSLQTFLGLAAAGGSAAARLGAVGAVTAIALAAGLGAAVAVKAFGITFLALPRTGQAERAHDASPAMVGGMGLAALAVLGLGMVPGAVLTLAAPVVSAAVPEFGSEAVPGAGGPLTWLSINPGTDLQPLATPAALLALVAAALLATVILGRGRPRWRKDMTWTCGIEPGARMEYSGAGFSKPILLMFRGVLQPVRTLKVDPAAHPLFPGQVHYQSELKAVFEQRFYRPVTQAVMGAATRLRRLQTGSLQIYLLYLLVAAVGVIVAAR